MSKKRVRKKIYECELCNYSTKIISNFKKHLNSKKHAKNLNLKTYIKCRPIENEKENNEKDEEKINLINIGYFLLRK